MGASTDDEQLERSYRRDGFVRVPVFSADEVRAIRDEVYTCFQRRHGGMGSAVARDLTSRDLLSQSKLLCAILHPRITALLTGLLGADCEYLPDFEVHINQYGIGGGGWHLDCGSGDPAALSARARLSLREVRHLSTAQRSRAGGGHRCSATAASLVPARRQRQNAISRAVRVCPIWSDVCVITGVPTAAGDFVAFDSRLPHRGTAPGPAIVRQLSAHHRTTNNFSGVIPPGRDKMVIYFDACRAGYGGKFLENSVRRAKAEIGQPWSMQYRAQYLGLQYPDDFPS